MGGLGLLQMLSNSFTEQCANKDAWPPWERIVRSHIGWKMERTAVGLGCYILIINVTCIMHKYNFFFQ